MTTTTPEALIARAAASASASRRPTTANSEPGSLPPIKCAPWCKYGDGHPNEWHPDDQWCSADGTTVALSAAPLLKDYLQTVCV
jgi:hypothetical protein